MSKKILKLLIIIFFSATNLYTQPFEFEHLNGPNGGIIGDLAIDSQGNIYAGAYSFWISYTGLYKSTDNGDSWTRLSTPDSAIEVYAIYIDENDDIYVGTNYGGRIFRSTDGGNTWDNPNEGYNTGECWAFGKSMDGIMFAGDGESGRTYKSTDSGNTWTTTQKLKPLVFATNSENTVYCGSFKGLFVTYDNGENWGLSNFLNDRPVATVIIDSFDGIYCGTGYYDNGNGVYYSPDKGETWNHLGLDSMVVLSLAFDSEDRLYAGTLKDGVFRLEDNGSWTQLTGGLDRRQVFRMKINKKDHIFIGSENEGVYRSTDGGNNFEQIGLPISRVENILFGKNSLLYTATPTGVQSYDPLTRNWNNLGLDRVEYIAFGPEDILYAATWADGIFKSSDYGNTWLETSQNRDSLTTVYNIRVLNDGTVLAATEKYLRKSTDEGITWEILPVKTSFFSSALYVDNDTVYVSAFNESEDEYFIYSITNGGNDVSPLKQTFSWTHKNSIFVDKDKKIWQASNIIDVNYGPGLFLSSKPYENWEKVFNKGSYAVTGNYAGLILTGTNQGIYYSTDNGQNWNLSLNVLSKFTFVTDIKLDEEGFIYASTDGLGLYKSITPTSVENEQIENTINNFRLEQNYPNPFNPITKIKYAVANVGTSRGLSLHTTLKVYDVLGEEIATLVNEIKPAGTYEVQFDASGLSSGVYFYELRVNDFYDVKKMTVLK